MIIASRRQWSKSVLFWTPDDWIGSKWCDCLRHPPSRSRAGRGMEQSVHEQVGGRGPACQTGKSLAKNFGDKFCGGAASVVARAGNLPFRRLAAGLASKDAVNCG